MLPILRLYLAHPLCLYSVFWLAVVLLNIGPDWLKYDSLRELLEVVGTTTMLQAAVAVVALRYLVPRYLDYGHVWRFALGLCGVLLVAAQANILISYFYLEPSYPNSYGAYYIKHLSHMSIWQRLGFSWLIRYIVFSKFPLLVSPAAMLIAINYYRRQRALLMLREKKQAAELQALKSQLNPHFIFNTLNNIYALAILQSSQTAAAIAMLSGILDYVLYRCRDNQVSLQNEVAMIEDYIALEKLRFGERLQVNFSRQLEHKTEVAPLLFLTLIENAFKHGAAQELKLATVDLNLVANKHKTVFSIRNSKPANPAPQRAHGGIGLINLRRQLQLLYPDSHTLEITDQPQCYSASLTLLTRQQNMRGNVTL